jgi:hypothetical protein
MYKIQVLYPRPSVFILLFANRKDPWQTLQISGTTKSTKMAPSYANIFMADFEEKHVYPYHTQQIFYG